MRLVKIDEQGGLSLTKDLHDDIPPYAILSHTWGADEDEIDYSEFVNGPDQGKRGYNKIRFCAEQAKKDELDHFWIDTCCINKANQTELSTAITSMFRWYREAEKCYVYLSDVDVNSSDGVLVTDAWEGSFRASRWFTRGWTLQELLAPRTVEFFSRQGKLLGSKKSLHRLVHEITTIPVRALRDGKLSEFPDDERMRWTQGRTTKLPQDKIYCMLGIFNVSVPFNYGEDEELVWRRFKEEIAKRTGPSPSVTHTHWIVKRHLNPVFIGREDLLKELQTTIRDAVFDRKDSNECRIVITGMGGQGKSELSLQLAHSLRQIFWGVFWIDVSTPSLAEKSFINLVQSLGLPAASSCEDACLRIANLKDPWLLVLDNADDPEADYQDYFPNGILGVVVLTSRVPECGKYATARHIELANMPEEKAQELLLTTAKIPSDDYDFYRADAKAVASLINSHTLALIQAGAYVARGHCTLAGYPDVFQQRRQRLLEFSPKQAKSRYGHVYATFEASADILRQIRSKEATDASQLLPLLAVCGPSRIPLSLFEECRKGAFAVPPGRKDDDQDDDTDLMSPWHIAQLPEFVTSEAETWDSFRLMEAASLLESLALITINISQDIKHFTMHPLVHAWARDRQGSEEKHENWVRMACIMAFSYRNPKYWTQDGQQLQPHLEALTSWKGETMYGKAPPIFITRILVRCGWELLAIDDFSRLRALLQEVFSFQRMDTTAVAPELTGLYQLAALNATLFGNTMEGVELFHQVVSLKSKRLAEDSPSLIFTQNLLAGVYEANGQPKEAMQIAERAVKMSQGLAEDNDRRLNLQRQLAWAYKHNGQLTKAIPLYEDMVRIESSSHDESDPDRLGSLKGLAYLYLKTGQIGKATELLEQTSRVIKPSLPENHPDRMLLESALAGAYYKGGRTEKAVRMFERLGEIAEQSFAMDQMWRFAFRGDLAMVYSKSERTEEAVKILKQESDHMEQKLGENSFLWSSFQHNLAKAYYRNGQVKEAKELIQHVVTLRKQSLAEDDAKLAASQQVLACILWDLGHCTDAVKMMERVVDILQQSFDVTHSKRKKSERILESFYKKMETREDGDGDKGENDGKYGEQKDIESNNDIEAKKGSEDEK